MKRRKFLSQSAVVASAAVAAPAIAQPAKRSVQWRMATSWPKSLDTIYGSIEALCARVSKLTDGEFRIRPFAGGEIVPALQVYDAVSNGTIECGHSLTSFYIGKKPVLAFDAGIPFGLNSRQQNGWMYFGGGLELLREVFRKDNMVNFPCGNVGAQMGGFYRKEINSIEDLKGLKFRIGGIGGTILARLGAVPQQIATADTYSALERGTIDAAEWVGPYDDEKLGLHKVAKYYYYPGWWEGSAQVSSMVNLQAWEALPEPFREAFEVACVEQNTLMAARYDEKNPAALKRLVAQGAVLRQFPRPVLEACYKATFETLDELAAKDSDFARVYASWSKYTDDSNLWFRVAEFGLDSFRYAMAAKK